MSKRIRWPSNSTSAAKPQSCRRAEGRPNESLRMVIRFEARCVLACRSAVTYRSTGDHGRARIQRSPRLCMTTVFRDGRRGHHFPIGCSFRLRLARKLRQRHRLARDHARRLQQHTSRKAHAECASGSKVDDQVVRMWPARLPDGARWMQPLPPALPGARGTAILKARAAGPAAALPPRSCRAASRLPSRVRVARLVMFPPPQPARVCSS